MLTLRSRGIESSAIRSLSGSTRSRIVVSDGRVADALGSRRLSEPMIRIVCGAPPSAWYELIAQRLGPVVVREAVGDVGEEEEDADRGRRGDRDDDQRDAARKRAQRRFARGFLPPSSPSIAATGGGGRRPRTRALARTSRRPRQRGGRCSSGGLRRGRAGLQAQPPWPARGRRAPLSRPRLFGRTAGRRPAAQAWFIE